MGGRGAVRFATQWTEKQLSNRVDTLSAQIKAIDDEAKRIREETYNTSYERNKNEDRMWSSDQWDRWAKLDAQDAYVTYLENTNRGELVSERKKLKSELDKLKSGQKTLFG